MNTKFIKVPTSEKLPEPGKRVVIDKNNELLVSSFHKKYSTDDFWLSNYKYFLLEVPDIEEELKDMLKQTHLDLSKAIETFTAAKEKIEFYQNELEKKQNEKPEISQDPHDREDA